MKLRRQTIHRREAGGHGCSRRNLRREMSREYAKLFVWMLFDQAITGFLFVRQSCNPGNGGHAFEIGERCCRLSFFSGFGSPPCALSSSSSCSALFLSLPSPYPLSALPPPCLGSQSPSSFLHHHHTQREKKIIDNEPLSPTAPIHHDDHRQLFANIFG